jgi:predicted small integral membrane protein
MIPRLALLTVVSTVLALLLLWVFQTYFSDVLPLAAAEAIHPNWRFQGAYLVTILIYVSVAVAFMSILGLIAMIGRRYLPEGRSSSS